MSIISRLLNYYRYKRTMATFKKMDVSEVFDTIYAQNYWGGEAGEYNSGPGTTNTNTSRYIEMITEFIKENTIKNIFEIGCGDFRIMSKVLKRVDVYYTGGDIVSKLIDRNNREFSNNKIKFIKINAVDDELPQAEMLIIRQVLQHLSNDQIKSILKKSAVYKYVLITEHVPVDCSRYNVDKEAGPNIRLYKRSGVHIDKEPFNLQINRTLLEYREDMIILDQNMPALIRTDLVIN